MMGWLIGLAVVMWIAQTVLGMRQFRKFNRHLKELRGKTKGRVAIGKARGRFSAGAVMLLAIDEDTTITRGEVMTGRTVFADFTPFDELNGIKLAELNEGHCRKLPRQLEQAALNARHEYENYCARGN